MSIKYIIRAACTCLVVVSFNVTAIPTKVDYLTPGDGLITYDVSTGLEWLDLTATAGMSYNDVILQMQDRHSSLFGWQYSTAGNVSTFFDSFGGVGPYNGTTERNNGLAALVTPFWGDTLTAVHRPQCVSGTPCYSPGSAFMVGPVVFPTGSDPEPVLGVGLILDASSPFSSQPNPTEDTVHDGLFRRSPLQQFPNEPNPGYGSALTRDRPVPTPEPPVVLLIALGLVVLGVARRKVHA